jgi:endonuclease YncB( thermonuclease family)
MIPILLSIASILIYHAPGVVGTYQLPFPDARVVVTSVADGDTLRIAPAIMVAGDYRDTVRLADINAPELNTTEGLEALGNLTNLITTYGPIVYLDIDSIKGVDNYGRIIAVAYLRYNSTHLLNINEWLVENGYAQVYNFTDNEFDPSTWSLYEEYLDANDNSPAVSSMTITSFNPGYYSTHNGFMYTGYSGNHVFAVMEEYSSNNSQPKVRAWIMDPSGVIYTPTILLCYNGTSINGFQGFVSAASNSSGVLVLWSQYEDTISGTKYQRSLEYAFINYNGNIAVQGYIGIESYQYAPVVFRLPGYDGWLASYITTIRSSATNTYTSYVRLVGINSSLSSPATLLNSIVLASQTGVNQTVNATAVGFEYLSRVMVDPVSGRGVIVARGWNPDTLHDIGLVMYYVNSSSMPDLAWIPVDTRPGPQGPSPVLASTSNAYYYHVLYGNIHAAMSTNGSVSRVLVVYNGTSTTLDYFVYDVTNNTTVKEPSTMASGLRDNYPYYPYVIPLKGGGWVVVYSDGYGNYNATLVDFNGVMVKSVPVAASIDWVRGLYDPVKNMILLTFREKINNSTVIAYYKPDLTPLNYTVKTLKTTPLFPVMVADNKLVILGVGSTIIVSVEGVYNEPKILTPTTTTTTTTTGTTTPTTTTTTAATTTTASTTSTPTATTTTTTPGTITTVTTTVTQVLVVPTTITSTITVTNTTTFTVTSTETVTQTITTPTTLTTTKTETVTQTTTQPITVKELDYTASIGVGIGLAVILALLLYYITRR